MMAKAGRKAFYDYNIFVVQPEKASSGKKNYWNILNPGGVKMGAMYHSLDSLPVRFLRKIGFSAQYGTKIIVEDDQGQPLMSFRKHFSFGTFTALCHDHQGLVGKIKEVKQGLNGRRYVFYNAQGQMWGCLEGDWASYSLQMKDGNNASIGKISRKSEEVNKVIFSEKSSYYVVHLYIDQEEKRWRHFLLAASAAIALLLR